ncbi:hypothetical protein ACLB2K_076750 [Fragaria x ananassa]
MSDAVINSLAVAGGGIIAQLITYPLRTMNTRQQTERDLKIEKRLFGTTVAKKTNNGVTAVEVFLFDALAKLAPPPPNPKSKRQRTDPGTELLERRDRRFRSRVVNLSHTKRRTGMHPFVLLPHRLKQRLHKQPHHRPDILDAASPFRYAARAPMASRHASFTPESASLRRLTMWEMILVRWVGAKSGWEAEGFFFHGGFGVRGGVVEAVEEHGEAVDGEGVDDFLEIFDGDGRCRGRRAWRRR